MPSRTSLFWNTVSGFSKQAISKPDSLNHEGVAVLGNKWLRLALGIILAGAVEVSLGDRAILIGLRGEESVAVSILSDELLIDEPQHLGPDFADRVDTPVTSAVEGLVGRGIDLLVLLYAVV